MYCCHKLLNQRPSLYYIQLSNRIYHVGGGAGDAYTGYKQSMLKDYRFVQLGETTLAGASKLARDAVENKNKFC